VSAPKPEVRALKVKQWLPGWETMLFSTEEKRRKPLPHFYLFSLSATTLRALSGIYRRSTAGLAARTSDSGIQRKHDPGRSDEIQRFVRDGFPFSALRLSDRRDDLRKPGWLPTAIVVNVLSAEDRRNRAQVAEADLITISEEEGSLSKIFLPSGSTESGWKPAGLPPIEVIDGQHRLWAFEDFPEASSYELPVVAFSGLDIGWQAYLFWVINIKPKKINASLAFDLYPLLRTEDWLEQAEGLKVYRETRAQELTSLIWQHPYSPWQARINMLGESGGSASVTQASWIRSLLNTLVKPWEGKRVSIGGLFGGRVGASQFVLPWSRAQQAAFLIVAWEELRLAIGQTTSEWAVALRALSSSTVGDLAFEGSATLLNTDQGVRGFLYILNDTTFLAVDELRLSECFDSEGTEEISTEESVADAISELNQHPLRAFLYRLAKESATFDWRTSSAPGLNEEERIQQAALRGSAGYKELRQRLLRHLANSQDQGLADYSREAMARLGYDGWQLGIS
jgi:hypothetical protein